MILKMVKIFGSPVRASHDCASQKVFKNSFLTLCLQHSYSKPGLSSLLELICCVGPSTCLEAVNKLRMNTKGDALSVL